MNPKYTELVNEEIQNLLNVGFIYLIKHMDWASLIVITKKKNDKIRVWVEFKKVNAVTQLDHFPLPYAKHVLEGVAGKKAFNFLDGFFSYNQVGIVMA